AHPHQNTEQEHPCQCRQKMAGISVFKTLACLVPQVRAKCNRNRNATRAYGDGERQRKEGMLQGVFQGSRLLLLRWGSTRLIEQTPPRGCNYKTARNLDNHRVIPKKDRISLPSRNETASNANP